MNTPTHLAVNTIIAIPLHYILGLHTSSTLIFILSGGIFIDIDHIFYFAIAHKTISPRKWIAIAKTMRKKMQPGLYIFHSPECNALLFVGAFFNKIILIIFLSNVIHIVLDIVEHYCYYKNFALIKKWSIAYVIFDTIRNR